jgi:hypothetical protein
MTHRRPERLDVDSLLRAFVAHEVEFVVVGGLAVAAHGYVRATMDLDIVPRPEADNRRRLHAALRSVDAELVEIGDLEPREMPVPFTPAALDDGGNWALRTRYGRVDVMQWIASVDSYDELHDRALVVELPDVGVTRFAGYEDLVAMKRAAGRPEDRSDLRRLRELRAE